MATSKFWYVPLKHILRENSTWEEIFKIEIVDETHLDPLAAQKLRQKGVAIGDLLALMDGTQARGLGRVLGISNYHLRWRSLPVSVGPLLTSAPNLASVPEHEAAEFKFGIDVLLRDERPSLQFQHRSISKALNVILYGPPGTGKTFSLRRRAVELLIDEHDASAAVERGAINIAWEKLRRSGQVVFCTFHQAFAYEDFVEGLRAETDENGGVHYRVVPGVFKSIARRAEAEWRKASTPSSYDFDDLWDVFVDFLKGEKEICRASTLGDKAGYYFRVGSNGNIQWNNAERSMPRWLAVTREHVLEYWEHRADWGPEPEKMTGEIAKSLVAGLTGNSGSHNYPPALVVYGEIYKIWNASRVTDDGRVPHFVLVIDEINRANIARVFGELITLLESDKRLGSANEVLVQLPASKEWFGVPPNLHVLGTMNTADRSIALMDVALRRRFTFEEMMPDAGVIRAELDRAGTPQPLQGLVVRVFEKLNARLRHLYDREHQIGHAYFLGVRTLDDLRQVFSDRILPLLQEYFFGQWDKVARALGYPLKAEGAPKEFRAQDTVVGTLLTVSRLEEKELLGLGYDEYVDPVTWDVHPAFRPRGLVLRGEQWLAEAFLEVAGAADRRGEAARLVAALVSAEEP